MDISYWQQRWEQGLTGFHLPDVNPKLQLWLNRLELSPGASIFVPLCGKSIDMLWLLRQGYNVIGAEASEIAAKSFFQENKLTYKKTLVETHVLYQHNNLRLYCGDFFRLTKNLINHCDAVYDRAALIALPESLRTTYARQIISLTDSKTKMLLVSMDYPLTQMQGPPFAVLYAEIKTLFSDVFTITQLDNQDILKESPKFQERGLSYINESTYLLTKKLSE